MKLPTLENPAGEFWGGFAAMLSDDEVALERNKVELFAGRKELTLAALEQCMETRSVAKGETIFLRGDSGDELFQIRRAFEVFAFSLASARACPLYEPDHAESRTADLRLGRLPARQTRHLFLWT